MHDNIYYVIKFDDKSYWTGYNNWSPQIRQARIYSSVKMAKEVAEDCLQRGSVSKVFNSYKVIAIKFIIIGEVEE